MVELSPWFLFCVALLAFYVGLQKRKSELTRMSETSVITRRVLTEYSISYLEQVETALLASILMTYALWTIQGAPTTWTMLSVPFVFYGLLRYQYLSGQEIVERPEELIFRDRPAVYQPASLGSDLLRHSGTSPPLGVHSLSLAVFQVPSSKFHD